MTVQPLTPGLPRTTDSLRRSSHKFPQAPLAYAVAGAGSAALWIVAFLAVSAVVG
ncbi:MAG: hypothetical protein KKA16_02660 [Alphaproteobacteria bacterium]|nr:hypothetical protein [Alphaproteobacteria bacterium]MBU2380732.1 hypothetical protein [Alphaproteobacteria bacterium]